MGIKQPIPDQQATFADALMITLCGIDRFLFYFTVLTDS